MRLRSTVLPRAFAHVLLMMVAATSARAAEPRVSFSLKEGWVDAAVSHEGKPVEGAVLRIIDEHGVRFAEGETGSGGDAAFPMPEGASCVVEIKTGSQTADPIRLIRTLSGVAPERVLLSYGLRPCCRGKLVRARTNVTTVKEQDDVVSQGSAGRSSARESSAPLWILAAILLLGGTCVAVGRYVRQKT